MGSVISFFKSSSSRSSSTTRSDACYSDSDTDTDTDNGSSSVPNRMLSYGSKKSPTSGDHAAHAAVCQTECCHMLSYGSKFADIADNFTSLEQVQDALVKEGLESSNLILGINFTKSNEWTGKSHSMAEAYMPLAMHLNPYGKAISIIGKTLSFFDEDNL